MPYEVESPLAAGLGAATAWYQGQQQGQDRQRKIKTDDEDRALAASQAAAQQDYWKANVAEREEAARLRAETSDKDRLIKKQTADAATQRVKDAKQNALMMHADRVADRLRKQAQYQYGMTHIGAAAQARINAMVQTAQARIQSGEIISANRLESMFSIAQLRADVSRENNVRTTDTSRANNQDTNSTRLKTNENTVQGAMDRTQFTEVGKDRRFNSGEQNKGARADQAQSIRAKKAVPSSPVAQAQMHLTPKQQGLLFEVRGALRDGVKLSAIQARMFENARKGMYTMLDAQAALDAVQGKETPSPPPPAAVPGGGPAQQPPFPGVR